MSITSQEGQNNSTFPLKASGHEASLLSLLANRSTRREIEGWRTCLNLCTAHCFSGGRFFGRVWSNEDFGRYAQARVKLTNHAYGERSFSIQDFGDTGTGTDKRLKVPAGEAAAFQEVKYSFNRVREWNCEMSFLVSLDQGCQNFQSVPFRSVRRGVKKALYSPALPGNLPLS